MSRTIFAASALAALLFAMGSAGDLLAQGQTTGRATGGGSAFGSGGSFGQGTSGFGATATQGLGQGFGLGYAALGGQSGFGGGLGGQLGGLQNRSLTQAFGQQRTQQLLQQNQQNLQNLVPVRLQVATAAPRIGTSAVASAPVPVQGRMARFVNRGGMGNPLASWEGDVLILSGTVANDNVRRTLEGIALLEPGVRSVRNEMVVGDVPPAPATAPVGN
jgi:hypothetical protein